MTIEWPVVPKGALDLGTYIDIATRVFLEVSWATTVETNRA